MIHDGCFVEKIFLQGISYKTPLMLLNFLVVNPGVLLAVRCRLINLDLWATAVRSSGQRCGSVMHAQGRDCIHLHVVARFEHEGDHEVTSSLPSPPGLSPFLPLFFPWQPTSIQWCSC